MVGERRGHPPLIQMKTRACHPPLLLKMSQSLKVEFLLYDHVLKFTITGQSAEISVIQTQDIFSLRKQNSTLFRKLKEGLDRNKSLKQLFRGLQAVIVSLETMIQKPSPMSQCFCYVRDNCGPTLGANFVAMRVQRVITLPPTQRRITTDRRIDTTEHFNPKAAILQNGLIREET